MVKKKNQSGVFIALIILGKKYEPQIAKQRAITKGMKKNITSNQAL
jgi:hypothetical protein